MKTTLCIAVALSAIGCTTYPKQYTYSPTVTVNGGSEVMLPNPYSKHKNVIKESPRTCYASSIPPRSYDVEPNRFYYDPVSGELYDSRQ